MNQLIRFQKELIRNALALAKYQHDFDGLLSENQISCQANKIQPNSPFLGFSKF
jgi:hypothetical protein